MRSWILGGLLLAAGAPPAQDAPDVVAASIAAGRGDALVAEGRAADALVQFTQAMQRAPDDAQARLRALAVLNEHTFPLARARLDHTGPVLAGEWSADGARFATGGADGKVNVFDTSASRLLTAPAAHPGGVLALVFSADGRELATAGADGKARVSDARTGKALAEFDAGSPVSSLSFGENERLLVVGNEAWLWDWKTEQPARRLPVPAPIRAARLAARGHLLAVALDTQVLLFDARNGGLLRALTVGASALEIDPGGMRVATATGSKVRLWDAVTGREIFKLAHDGKVNALAFSADGRRLATAAADARARVWDLETGELLGPPANLDGAVLDISLSANGTRLATLTARNTAHVWDAATGQPVTIRVMQNGRQLLAKLSPDGGWLLTGEDNGAVRWWDARPFVNRTGPFVLATGWSALHRGAVSDLALTRGEDDRTLRLVNATTGTPVGRPMTLGAPVVQSAFNPSGTRVVTVDEAGNLQTWDTATARQLGATLAVLKPGEFPLQFSPDGRLLAVNFADGVGAISLATADAVAFEFDLGATVETFAFRADSARLFIGGENGRGRLWSPKSARPLASLNHTATIYAAEFDPTNRLLATASADGTARLWNAETGTRFGAPLAHESAVRALAFSTDGAWLATGTEEGKVRIWNTATRALAAGPREFAASVQQLTFGPTGRWLQVDYGPEPGDTMCEVVNMPTLTPLPRPAGPLSGFTFGPKARRLLVTFHDNSAQLFDSATGRPVGMPLTHDGAISSAIFTRDGRTVLTASWDSTARVWDSSASWPLTGPLVQPGPVTQAAFSMDETRVLSLVGERDLIVTPLGPWTHPAPDWFPILVEALTGVRVGDNGTTEYTDAQRSILLDELRKRFATAPPGDAWSAWGRRFLTERVAR